MNALAAVLLIWLSDDTIMAYEYPDAAACGEAILRLVDRVREIDPGADLLCPDGSGAAPTRSIRPLPRP